MNDHRLLTAEEAALLCQTAERWLRRGEHELNLGERAAKLLARATVRPEACDRSDIASVDSSLEVELWNCKDLLQFTLVRPQDADTQLRRISFLTAFGLSFIGLSVGTVTRVQSMTGSWNAARILASQPSAEMVQG